MAIDPRLFACLFLLGAAGGVRCADEPAADGAAHPALHRRAHRAGHVAHGHPADLIPLAGRDWAADSAVGAVLGG